MNKYRILIVEDEALIAASFVHVLFSLGYTVLEPVATGEDAIRAVKTQKPDLVLMDIVLIGEMDGIVAAENIRAIADIPIIYLTAYTDDLRLKQARLTEPYGYIVKPAQNRELNASIEMALYKHALDRKLKESEETFKALAKNANDGILVSVADGAYTYANIRAGEITGYSVAELLKTSIMDLAAPDEVKNLMERFRKRLAGEDIPQQYETLIIRKDGKSVPIEFTAAKTSWHGQPADLVIIRDITERKRAEEALRKERDFAESVVGTAQAIIMVLDMKGHIVYLNPYMEEISGYILEEVEGKDWFETFLPSHIQESTRSLFLKAVWDIQTCGNVNAIITRDGRERLIEWHDKTLKNADGSIEGLLAIGHDVTDQKQMEEALRKSEEKYRGLIEQTGEGVWIIDRDYRTTFVNNRLAAMFGYTPQEMTGKQLQEFMPAGDMEVHSRRIMEWLDGKSDRFEQKFFRKDGSTLWAIASVTPWLAEENRVVGTFVMLTDITERKRMEDVLLESEAKFRLIADNTADNIWIFDMDMHLQYISPSVKKMKGFTVEEALSQSLEEMMTPESLESLMKRFHQEMALEASGTADPDRTISFETEEYCKTGATIR
ncbi:MAG: PAS domain S-box protein, partial [Methanoregula sp.]|nr:PAS domain S-box protein [Methanoregula sp.]